MKPTLKVLLAAVNAGVLDGATIAYKPIRVIGIGAGTPESYPCALKTAEQKACQEVRSAINSWLYSEER